MDNRFTTMLKAVETAGAQFSVTYSNDADNAAVLTELAVDLVDALRSLVWSAGADMDYFDTAKDDFLIGIDQAFSDQAEINKIIKSRQMHLDAERARLNTANLNTHPPVFKTMFGVPVARVEPVQGASMAGEAR